MFSKIISLKWLVVIAMLAFLVSCGDDGEAANKNEMENGNKVPVAVKPIEEEYFKKELTFFTSLSGIMQTTRSSAVGGRIEKVNFKVGDYVKKDQIVVEFPEDNPAVQFEQAKHAFENSKKTYERMKALLDAGETSQANFDGAETKFLVDKRNYEMAIQVLFIDAPYDGIIVEIMVNEGDGVDSKIPLFTIAKLNKMKARIWTSEDEIRQIKNGMTAEVNYNGKVYEGRVTHKSMAMDPMKRAFYAEVEFDNPNNQLKPGLTLEVAVKIYENKNALIVPRHLINNSSDEKSVYVVVNGKAEERKIKTGFESGISVEILEGLKPGDKIIVKGANMVSNGQLVNEVQ
ncbi:putative co/zn/cd efflux system membrane fusion protein [hydrocarbon metagenome]|uniref:Putative co/zn/cd efflux system membrane fusion protein n=1 Tax=hydrocarbon metagenome TaxID=938273 RepID=A0A0W8FV40_9ZZZZ